MKKLSRNDLCWCGSGKKYKKCHMDEDIQKGKVPKGTVLSAPGVIIKTLEQIDGIRQSCRLTKEILDMVESQIKEGITTEEINTWVHKYTIDKNAVPAPLNYNGFPKSVCTSINNVVCHGIPDQTILKNGDIINVDVTCILDGYYGDASRMFYIGETSSEAKKLVEVCKESL
jgi:methionyl aminopeptidase